jgi:hypothetical protein
MAILELDTDQLRSAVSVAEKANQDITEAMNFLDKIVVHNDWVCPERDTINENTERNKNTASTIQQNAEAFYNAVKQASERFDETEQNNISRTNKVDGLISGIVNIVRGAFSSSTSAPSIGAFGGISGSMKDNGGGGGHSF